MAGFVLQRGDLCDGVVALFLELSELVRPAIGLDSPGSRGLYRVAGGFAINGGLKLGNLRVERRKLGLELGDLVVVPLRITIF